MVKSKQICRLIPSGNDGSNVVAILSFSLPPPSQKKQSWEETEQKHCKQKLLWVFVHLHINNCSGFGYKGFFCLCVAQNCWQLSKFIWQGIIRYLISAKLHLFYTSKLFSQSFLQSNSNVFDSFAGMFLVTQIGFTGPSAITLSSIFIKFSYF